MNLEQYETPEEKKSHFKDYQIVRTTKEFDDMCKNTEALERKNLQKYLFRGLNSARYKLYTSAQRLWIEGDLSSIGLTFNKYILNLIKSFNNDSCILNRYFRRLGIIKNDWLILSYLQHHGASTPLLDFTKQFKTALFFSLDDIKGTPGAELDNYVSIYYYKAVDVANKVSKSIYKLAKDKAKALDWDKDGKLWKELSFSNVTENHKTILVPTYASKSNIKNSKQKMVSIYTVANLNSTAQEGEFVCNSDENTPLEDIWNINNERYLSCIDIHKGLVDYILNKYLKVESLAAAKLKYYPNEHNLAMQIQRDALSQ